MAFKIKAPYTIDNTPVYRVEFKDPAVHGVTLNTGCIVINKNLPKDVEEQTMGKRSLCQTKKNLAKQKSERF